MPDIAYLEWRYSGGVNNTDPLLSIGGVRAEGSNKRVQSQTVTSGWRDTFRQDTDETVNRYHWRLDPWPLGPQYLNQAMGMLDAQRKDSVGKEASTSRQLLGGTEGQGTIEFEDGSAQIISRDGTSSWVDANSGSFRTVSDVTEGVFDNVTSTDAWNGLVDYRLLYLFHAGRNKTAPNGIPGQEFRRVSFWIDVQPQSAQIDLGFNLAEYNTEVATLADRFTAPSGITFVDYDSEENALYFDVVEGLDMIPIWFRRTVFPMQSSGDISGDQFDLLMVAHG